MAIEEVGPGHLNNSDSETVTQYFVVLADEQRRAILNLLKSKELQPWQIERRLGYDCRSLSYHLKKLRKAKLVSVRMDGKCHYYRLNVSECSKLLKIAEMAIGPDRGVGN